MQGGDVCGKPTTSGIRCLDFDRGIMPPYSSVSSPMSDVVVCGL